MQRSSGAVTGSRGSTSSTSRRQATHTSVPPRIALELPLAPDARPVSSDTVLKPSRRPSRRPAAANPRSASLAIAIRRRAGRHRRQGSPGSANVLCGALALLASRSCLPVTRPSAEETRSRREPRPLRQVDDGGRSLAIADGPLRLQERSNYLGDLCEASARRLGAEVAGRRTLQPR